MLCSDALTLCTHVTKIDTPWRQKQFLSLEVSWFFRGGRSENGHSAAGPLAGSVVDIGATALSMAELWLIAYPSTPGRFSPFSFAHSTAIS